MRISHPLEKKMAYILRFWAKMTLLPSSLQRNYYHDITQFKGQKCPSTSKKGQSLITWHENQDITFNLPFKEFCPQNSLTCITEPQGILFPQRCFWLPCYFLHVIIFPQDLNHRYNLPAKNLILLVKNLNWLKLKVQIFLKLHWRRFKYM